MHDENEALASSKDEIMVQNNIESKKKNLRNKIIKKIKEYPLEKVRSQDKEVLRQLHEKARIELLMKHRKFITTKGEKIIEKYFANGSDINPEEISPILIPVRTKEQWDIFRTARFTWSLPYTFGYGRRLCFLIMDQSNNKLMGVLGCQSPTLGLSLRNNWLGLKGKNKVYKLNKTLDIYTLGAVPPYNILLAGKLVAMSAVSNEVREFYEEKYADKTTEMEGNIISPDLVLLSTTSAFGKSSIYNRVKYKDKLLCFSLGYTKGIGTFKYTDEICSLMKQYLELINVEVKGGYGNGPNYKFRLINTAIRYIGEEINLKKYFKVKNVESLVRHSVQREVYVFPLAKNVKEYLNGINEEPEYYNYSFEDLANYWKDRYLKRRAQTNDKWRTWDKTSIKKSLLIK